MYIGPSILFIPNNVWFKFKCIKPNNLEIIPDNATKTVMHVHGTTKVTLRNQNFCRIMVGIFKNDGHLNNV